MQLLVQAGLTAELPSRRRRGPGGGAVGAARPRPARRRPARPSGPVGDAAVRDRLEELRREPLARLPEPAGDAAAVRRGGGARRRRRAAALALVGDARGSTSAARSCSRVPAPALAGAAAGDRRGDDRARTRRATSAPARDASARAGSSSRRGSRPAGAPPSTARRRPSCARIVRSSPLPCPRARTTWSSRTGPGRCSSARPSRCCARAASRGSMRWGDPARIRALRLGRRPDKPARTMLAGRAVALALCGGLLVHAREPPVDRPGDGAGRGPRGAARRRGRVPMLPACAVGDETRPRSAASSRRASASRRGSSPRAA